MTKAQDPIPLLTPRLKESVQVPTSGVISPEGWGRARDTQEAIMDLANGFRGDYAEATNEVVGVLVPPALTVMERDNAPPEDVAAYRLAVTIGLAAGQYEAAHDLAPAPDKINPSVHAALILAQTDLGFRDVIAAYLMWVGHYIGRHGGEGLDEVNGMLQRDYPKLS